MVYTALIIFHALSGFAGFVAGTALVLQIHNRARQERWFWVYGAGLAGLLVFMIGAVLAHWSRLGVSQRLTFVGLIALGLFMAWRARLALRAWRAAKPGWETPFIDHIGFTLISLFDGFVIVGALDLHAPGWVVGVVAVVGVVVGIRTLGHLKRSATKRLSHP